MENERRTSIQMAIEYIVTDGRSYRTNSSELFENVVNNTQTSKDLQIYLGIFRLRQLELRNELKVNDIGPR